MGRREGGGGGGWGGEKNTAEALLKNLDSMQLRTRQGRFSPRGHPTPIKNPHIGRNYRIK